MYAAESVLIGRDPWELLAEAIVVSAARDLRSGYRRLMKLDATKEKLLENLKEAEDLCKSMEVKRIEQLIKNCDQARSSVKGTIKSCENFFRGGWFDTLAMHEISGEGIIEKLQKETGYGSSDS